MIYWVAMRLPGWIIAAILVGTAPAAAVPLAYEITLTTAYATANPFPNRVDSFYIEPDTGFLRIANTGPTAFRGTIRTIAVSAFAGDLSFTLPNTTLAAGHSISIAMAFDSSDVGGYNGPAYFYRPGIQIYLSGVMTDGTDTMAVDLMVADRDIHSGVYRTTPSGLTTDSFVLQGGDPWGFDPGDAFELSQANGTFVFRNPVPAPPATPLLLGLLGLFSIKGRANRGYGRRRRGPGRPASTDHAAGLA